MPSRLFRALSGGGGRSDEVVMAYNGKETTTNDRRQTQCDGETFGRLQMVISGQFLGFPSCGVLPGSYKNQVDAPWMSVREGYYDALSKEVRE